MLKRGIAPLIATIIIVGFTIALGAVVVIWGGTFVRNLQQSTEKTAAKEITCLKDMQIDIRGACLGGDSIRILINNLGSQNITSFNVRIKGDNGDQSSISSSGLSAYQLGSVSVNFDQNIVGNPTKIEVFPMIIFEREEAICSNTYDKETDFKTCSDVGFISSGNLFLIMKKGLTMATFDYYSGDIKIRGTLEENSNRIATSNDEFILSYAGEDVFILDLVTGNLYIDGNVFENQESLSLSSTDDFAIKDSNGNVVSYVDSSGSVHLKGSFREFVDFG